MTGSSYYDLGPGGGHRYRIDIGGRVVGGVYLEEDAKTITDLLNAAEVSGRLADAGAALAACVPCWAADADCDCDDCEAHRKALANWEVANR